MPIVTIYYDQVGVERRLTLTSMQGRHGPFPEEIRRRGLTNHIIVREYGIGEVGPESSTPRCYHPETDFCAKPESARGMHGEVTTSGNNLQVQTWLATCDPRSQACIAERYEVAVLLQNNAWCRLERIRDPKHPASTRL